MKFHFLISRTDNIGDVVLTLPLAYYLKKNFKNSKVSFLAKDYVREVVEAHSSIDEFISLENLIKKNNQHLIQFIHAKKIDTIFHVYPNKNLARVFYRAKIRNRIGTKRRFFHWLYCNQRINLIRKNSLLHESQLNLKILEPLGIKTNIPLEELRYTTSLKPRKIPIPFTLEQKKFKLIVHPGSNGSSHHWHLHQFIELINSLDPKKFQIFITGSDSEKKQFEATLKRDCPQSQILCGRFSLGELLSFMKQTDGLIAGSTGPLHMAASLGIHALGLYPQKLGLSSSRWGPLGPKAQVLSAPEKCIPNLPGKKCLCMSSLKLDTVKQTLESWLYV